MFLFLGQWCMKTGFTGMGKEWTGYWKGFSKVLGETEWQSDWLFALIKLSWKRFIRLSDLLSNAFYLPSANLWGTASQSLQTGESVFPPSLWITLSCFPNFKKYATKWIILDIQIFTSPVLPLSSLLSFLLCMCVYIYICVC